MSIARATVVGMDIGKTTLSFAVGGVSCDGRLEIERAGFERHLGRPLEAFARLYCTLDHGALRGIAATGVHSGRLGAPIASGLPEEIAQEHAAGVLAPGGPLNVVRLGGRGYSVLTRDREGRFRFEENDKCSAGAGETIEKICARLGHSLEEAVELAGRGTDPIPISARCSVFAKSEITHYANQGEPHGRLLAGYFESVARNVHALYDKHKVDGPVLLVGGGFLIGPVAEAMKRLIATPAEVSGRSGVFEAIGALAWAAGLPWDRDEEWPRDPGPLIQARQSLIHDLKPAAALSGSVTRIAERRLGEDRDAPVILGIDLGSTGSKAALIEAGSGRVVADFYRRTEGNPVEAAKALCGEVLADCGRGVAAVGLTGSGRDAAATVFRAAFPDHDGSILVQNEIVAHATAAVAYDPDGGKSLSIVEIGGQDAKFINVASGRIIESDLNRACSAGTGSFLEEQAAFYGVDDIRRVGEMAASSSRPPDLGQMCTVFVADLAAEALNEGRTVEDIFAGFQYSVILNYQNRVMGSRRFLDRIMFQGKPASSPSLCRTLAAVTGREVLVPPNPGAMGAIGIAMLAARDLEETSDRSLDLGRIVDARIVDRKTFLCPDPKCKNLCRIERAAVEVGGKRTVVLSGGACPRYEAVSAGPRKLPRSAPSPFREREDLLEAVLAKTEAAARAGVDRPRPKVGIPYAHCLMDYLPYFYAFFRHLGAEVKVLRSGPGTLEKGNRRCSAANTCTPVKIMHGLADGGVDFLFMPKFVELPRPVPGSGASTCPMIQGTPQMVEQALKAEGIRVKVLRPIFRMGARGFESPAFLGPLRRCWEEAAGRMELRGFGTAFGAACQEASRCQEDYERGLMEIGARAIVFARQEGFPVVLVAGASHVVHEPIMNAGIPQLIARNGAMAVPLDCFPVPDSIPALERVYWSASNRLLRASIAAARAGDVFPVMMASYGCGPSSFVEHFFNHLMEDYPHTILESDGHGGQAGYVTRIQAFLHSARSFEKPPPTAEAVRADRIELYDRFPLYTQEEIAGAQILVTSTDEPGGRQSVAILKGLGYEADYRISADAEAFKLGRRDCSGKECLPHQLIWGAYRKYLEDCPPGPDDRILFPNISGVIGPCRTGMFTLANQIAIERLGLSGRVGVITSASFKNEPAVVYGKWISMVATDILSLLRLYYRPGEKRPGEADRLFMEYADRLADIMVKFARERGLRNMARNVGVIEDLAARASLAFSDMEKASRPGLRTVYLCGDVFMLTNDFGNDDIARRLNDLGLRVIFQPFADIIEFLMFHRSREVFEAETRPVLNYLVRGLMERARNRLVAAVQKHHPWVRWEGQEQIHRACRELLDAAPICEAMGTIGRSLLAWRNWTIDGVVATGPWGCGPSLIAEAQLRRRPEIPALFIYHDGDPVEQARLAGFAWRLQNRPAREAVPPAASRDTGSGSARAPA